MTARTDHMGPLPEGDRQDTLQQLSLKALRNRLPEDRFLFRREAEDDKGIDGTLDAKVNGRFTNCRASAQLKSTDRPRRNQDGSVSFVIETSNLNYLLNGTTPLYFLWIEPAQEMRYAWAWDEWRRLDAETPGWREQETFTVRFRDVLDAKAVEALYERVINEARLVRDIREKMARLALSERVVVSIDPHNLTSDDPDNLFAWITESGLTIVSSGYAKQVLQWYDILDPARRRDPRIQLVAAYAQAALGRYHAASGHIAEASARRSHLSASGQRILDHLRDVCRYQTGGMDMEEYLRREREQAAKQTGAAAAAHRIEALRTERLASMDQPRRHELLGQMREAFRVMQASGDAAPAQIILARLNLLYAEGDELTGEMSSEVMTAQARRDMGLPPPRPSGRLQEAWLDWEKRAREIIQQSHAERHPLLLAEAVTVRLTVYQSFLATRRMEAFTLGVDWEPPLESIRTLAAEVEWAREVFRRADSMEGETRTKLLLADFRYLAGDLNGAKTLAEEALPVAQAMDYGRLESHAMEYAAGPTAYDRFKASITAGRAEDGDARLARQTDESLRDLSENCLRIMGLPAERLPVVERDWHSMRLIAQEKLTWCRHINVKQELGHMQSPATAFVTDPARFCVCEKLGHEANVRHTDTAALVTAFKRAYCEGCADRSPKGNSGA